MTYFLRMRFIPTLWHHSSKRCHKRAPSRSCFPVSSVMSWNLRPVNIRHRIMLSSAPRLFSWPRTGFRMSKLGSVFRRRDRSSACGVSDFSISEVQACTMKHAPGVRPVFPPDVVMQIKAMACELPATSGLPLSRFSRDDLVREAISRGVVAHISGTTIWRWLEADAIRPCNIAVGFSLAPKTSPKELARCWTFTKVIGKARPWAMMSSSSRRTRKRAFRPASECILRCRRNPVSPCAWSSSTNAAGPWPIWRLGTCGAQKTFGRCVPTTGIVGSTPCSSCQKRCHSQ